MRVLNRIVAALVALVLFLGGLVVAVEIIVAGRKHRPWLLPHDRWYGDLRFHPWQTSSIRWALFAVAVVGLLLLLLQLIRRRPLGLPLTPRQQGVEVEVSRRSLERYLSRAAERVQGIASARTRLNRGQARVKAWTPRRTIEGLDADVRDAVRTAVRGLGLRKQPKVLVSVRGRER